MPLAREREGRALRARSPARWRSAAVTSRSAAARKTTRRARTTLSIRPRPTAPANRPTVRSQAARSGRSSIDGGAGLDPALTGSRRAAARGRPTSRSTSSAIGSAAWSGAIATVRLDARPGLGDGERRQDERRGTERRPRIVRRRHSAAEPESAEEGRARSPGPRHPSRPHRRAGRRHAVVAAANRSGPPPSKAHARPIPTIDRSAAGWSQSAASRPCARAAANRSIGSIGVDGGVRPSRPTARERVERVRRDGR